MPDTLRIFLALPFLGLSYLLNGLLFLTVGLVESWVWLGHLSNHIGLWILDGEWRRDCGRRC